jgi:uncharacterized sulfatase
MDERYDMVRSVRDKRYIYIRNYMPHRIYGQHLAYMFQTPTTRVWKELYDQGRLSPAQSRFWEVKPPEELYDLWNDPDEVDNLADSPEHTAILKRLRQAQRELVFSIRDVGFLPEAEIHQRSAGSTPYQMGHDHSQYPLGRIFPAAELATGIGRNATEQLVSWLQDQDSAVRYWAALGFLIRGESAVSRAGAPLRLALQDHSPSVRIAAAEALGRFGDKGDLEPALQVLLELAAFERNGLFITLPALNALDGLDEKAGSIAYQLRAFPEEHPQAGRRNRNYVSDLIKKILSDLDSSHG